jgi:hypothetical protein
MRDTIELCKAAGFPLMSFEGVIYVSPELERLVALVRADERAAPDLQSELDATNRQVEILSDALAESRREVDALVALARADEREACANVVEAAKADEEDWDSNDWNQAVEFCASRIRARKDK